MEKKCAAIARPDIFFWLILQAIKNQEMRENRYTYLPTKTKNKNKTTKN
jgi:hypothetical protein